MAGTEITMDAAALDRFSRTTRVRERARIATRVEEMAAQFNTPEVKVCADAMYAFAEELRAEGVPKKAVPVAELNAAEAARVDAEVAAEEEGLPEVHHYSDEEQAVAMVNHRVRFGITQRFAD